MRRDNRGRFRSAHSDDAVTDAHGDGDALQASAHGLQFFSSGGLVRWIVVDEGGNVSADGAGWHPERSAARREALMTLRHLLDTRMLSADCEVARYLRQLPSHRAAAIIEASQRPDPLG